MTGESVEQAALHRAAEADWPGRARREAAAILDECGVTFFGLGEATITNRDQVLGLLAVAWLQGVNFGAHDTLANATTAFDRLRAEL